MIGTLQQLKDYLGETKDLSDARLSSALQRATGLVNQYCRRLFEEATYTDELYDGTGTPVLQLDKYPLSAVSSVKEDGAALTIGTNPAAGDYSVLWYAAEGHLVRPSGIWIPLRRNYAVTYTAGYSASAMPPEVLQGALDYAALIVREKDRIGIESKTTGEQTTQYTRELPKFTRQGLDAYRDWSTARRVV